MFRPPPEELGPPSSSRPLSGSGQASLVLPQEAPPVPSPRTAAFPLLTCSAPRFAQRLPVPVPTEETAQSRHYSSAVTLDSPQLSAVVEQLTLLKHQQSSLEHRRSLAALPPNVTTSIAGGSSSAVPKIRKVSPPVPLNMTAGSLDLSAQTATVALGTSSLPVTLVVSSVAGGHITDGQLTVTPPPHVTSETQRKKEFILKSIANH